MRGFVLAAGLGTRFRPVTHTLPKPLVPICNRPLIAWAVESFLAAGVRDLIVNLHHLPEPLERYLRARFGSEAHFDFSFEPEILGTGGALRKVRPLLEHESEFLLVNGDTIQFPRFDELRVARRRRDSLAALTLRHPPAGDRFTPVFRDNGFVTGFGAGAGEALMFSGSHLFIARVFGYLPDKDVFGIVDEVYAPLLASGRETIAGIVDDSLWFDIGTPRRYVEALRELLRLTVDGTLPLAAGSRIVGDSIVDATSKGTVARSTLGARSIVEGVVRDSAVWDDCFIGRGVVVEGCIVAHGVTLDQGEYRGQLITRGAATAI